MLRHLTLVLALGMLGACVGQDTVDEADSSEACEDWSYELGACGPPWDESVAWAECTIGADQSPVDIVGAVPDPALDPLVVAYAPITNPVVRNDGHSLEVDYDGGVLTLGTHQLQSGQFHVHVPAEHAVDGVRADMEIHIVHVDALGEPAAVVALRFNVGEENPVLADLWQDPPEDVGETVVPGAIDVMGLIPPSTAYWTYSGSLTTPPCSQGLRWIVLQQIGTVSHGQIELVHDRFGDNARALQPINNRSITEHES
jgi:carbonic anhydrase